ncbi:hypothetical protein B566_EDAN006976 [Ephemera danica]|nr:hypothetical protein B566_EDAN006976 [Ephemera danica]
MNCTLPCLGILQLGHRIKHASIYKETLENLTMLNGFLNNINFPSVPELSPEILPKIRNKVLIITLGAQPLYYPKDGEMSFCNGLCIFSWISRQSRWYTELRRIHAPAEFPALIAINLRLGCSYRYSGLQDDAFEIVAWLESVINQNISPTVVFSPKDWKPLHPAVDYLKLLEDERHEMDQSIIMDNEDPFIFPDGIGLVEPNNIFE